ncbi:carboxymuconolactone decarboxylase family protein [Dyadobacter fanqingshengii]|uniref:Carboxymuconolactone decarboxylase family protein n=1 Tax=Dyadobacter fanqingshengii TaxID=2906443 RepID=A0A9X1P8I0_9BACT|nr:carboxymuconolactone decarboxylase family protein [Dyadobacter fanqingshengii]MCF0038682.1 carboxymuconolactone decarboxylase family protein [Dyadobacter fanqingshengii]USJ34485.1 carboxymuconolactone decarboxylase family protein [Dyadobacter fanqingshengii]
MDSPFLSPIEKPRSFLWKLLYSFTRRRFGKVITPIKVMAVRLPLAFGSFSGKIGQLDKKLQLPPETVMLIRERVAQINVCLFCIDIGRAHTIMSAMNQAKFDALPEYETSTLFDRKEKVLLDFVTILARDRKMEHELFEKLAQYYDERSICEIVWIVATEFYYNISNIGLNIHSDMICDIAQKKMHQTADNLVPNL